MKHLPVIPDEIDGCWSRIGVTGDRSCPELVRHVHCRNCTAYAGAAQRNLQRPVDLDYRAEWERELGRPAAPSVQTDAAAMVFRVGAEWLAAPLALVASVARKAPVHRLPHRSAGALLGIVNVDGRLLPAVSLAVLLGTDTRNVPTPLGRHTFARVLVLAAGGQSYALPVDEVRGMLRYAAATLRAPAASVLRAPMPLVAGIVTDKAIEAGLLDAALLETRLGELLR